jgi:hypothetical protein
MRASRVGFGFATTVLVAAGLLCRVAGAQDTPALETLYVNAETGDDGNPGTKDKPLKSIPEAARRVTEGKGSGPTAVSIAPGLYALDRTALFKPGRSYTKEARLTIRAEVLPDDPDWNPAQMPVVISTMPLSKTWMGRPDPFGGVSYGLQIETSHATVQGLRILGSPVHEHPDKRAVRRNYPIVREGRGLDDLLITQCLFLGDEDAAPNHVSILANGHGVVVDHCVFSGCKVTVVYWFAEGGRARGCGMRHCLVLGAYGCGLWTMSPGDDFEFHHNVIADSFYTWITEGRGKREYRATDSIFAGNKHLAGTGAGPLLNFQDADPGFLKLAERMVTDKRVDVERDQTKRGYLHLVPGTLGADLGAGLFTTKAGE